MTPRYDHTWYWRKNLPERKGQRCRIVARGKMNSIEIEFEDGVHHIVSRYAVRKINDRKGEERWT